MNHQNRNIPEVEQLRPFERAVQIGGRILRFLGEGAVRASMYNAPLPESPERALRAEIARLESLANDPTEHGR